MNQQAINPMNAQSAADEAAAERSITASSSSSSTNLTQGGISDADFLAEYSSMQQSTAVNNHDSNYKMNRSHHAWGSNLVCHPDSSAYDQQQQHTHICTQKYMHHPRDGSVLLDHRGEPLSIDRMLGSQPLQSELATRPGPGNKRLTYLKGDAVARLLNQVFGYDGWNLTILKSERLVPPGGDVAPAASNVQPHSFKFVVAYVSHVRITLLNSSSSIHNHNHSLVFREDVGFGDATDRSFSQAAAHAQKSSITDGLKRAARHFGDRLGNSLYDSAHFTFNTAPKTQEESLDDWEKRWNQKYGNHNGNSSGDDMKQHAVVHKEHGKAAASITTTSQAHQPPTNGYRVNQQQQQQPQPPPLVSSNSTSTFMGAPTTTTTTTQASTALPPPPLFQQQQPPMARPSMPHSSAAATSASTAAANNAGSSYAVAPNQPPLTVPSRLSLAAKLLPTSQQQQPSPPMMHWARNNVQSTTSTAGGHAAPTNVGNGAAPGGNGSSAALFNSVAPGATLAAMTNTPFIQQHAQTSTSMATTTKTTFDFYDATQQRPTTSHKSSHPLATLAQPQPHQVTPMNHYNVDNKNMKRSAPPEVSLTDSKKIKPAATMNPYGPRI
ncbi:hypothetical protein MPSEU_001079100 [Mayamaea pseudoterrestris]|nr:hypothetical protein MPSEU_001079100 [Mayamaea pseudoterrestris]